MSLPEVRYARSGEVAIANQVVGSGGVDIVFARHMSGDLLSSWEQPLLVRHIEGLAKNRRLLMLDRRGTGLSDRVREVQSLETTMDDIRAVMDDAGSERAILWTGLHRCVRCAVPEGVPDRGGGWLSASGQPARVACIGPNAPGWKGHMCRSMRIRRATEVLGRAGEREARAPESRSPPDAQQART